MSGFFVQFVHGLQVTVLVAAASGILGTLLGLFVAVIKLSQLRLPVLIGQAYTTIVRGLPELLVILVVYFGGTAAITALTGRYVEISAFAAGVAALTVVFGAYCAEIFRGAIQSIPQGQTEAALSLGLASWQVWLLVILPQMIRVALPAFGNLWVSLLKDTSLISIVGLTDIMRVAFIGAGSMRAPLTFYLAASALYLAMTSLSLASFRLLERRLLIPDHQKG
ncbi:ABC transporter permease subunit [Agrobacterium sp. SHOUNA12C]|uniref:Nopaline ABC transporter n=1 Tax=Rhizobium rhizogenes (strain K84 / ATCC BAA-868) TaxID=311403 RepID=B9JE75_RHIR8|nr:MULTISPECIES: ABC transporter permease subunit [Rhizobium]ACM28420.1 nopaline ABC transporter [Rhizobium rhizogenes K84]MCJ9722148.1 ABC transporter permease subunit [Agrobacterium sp. BETTINA12B]MCJ9758982.1 ABC transporter permease subunit [Agrobacterium sp. SHOUNA12C]OCJ20318.1 ABC transporter [Agrobacterium sp. B131/95]EJK83692.1 amine acid ABC transporter, permease protein, 3-TM region, His/Glu/Gln/Arg/opine family [Rhizobium sp. AP16]